MRISDSDDPGAKGLVESDEGGAVDGCAGTRGEKIRRAPTAMSTPNMVRPGVIMFAGTHMLCQDCLIDIVKSRVLLYLRDSRDLCKSGMGSI